MRTKTNSSGMRSLFYRATPPLACFCALAGSPNPALAQVTEYFDQSAFSAATAGASLRTIGFDDRPAANGALLGGEYTSQGLTIEQRSGWPMNLVSSVDIQIGSGTTGIGSVNSQPNTLSSTFQHPGYLADRDDQYNFTFACPTTAAGLYLGNIGPGQTIIEFRSEIGSILAAEVIDLNHAGVILGPGPNDNRMFYGITSVIPISRIRIVTVFAAPDGVVFDDVQWSLISLPLTQQPQPALTCPGGSAAFTVAAAGATAYQWQFLDAGAWLNIPEGGDIVLGAGAANAEFFGHTQGSTQGTLTVSAILSPRDHPSGLPLRCIVSGTCTGSTSDTATLTVCYANCDCSTTPPSLNVQDFGCFLNRFASGNPLANCDGSTTPPTLNVQDFGCFLNRFAAGCP